MRPDRTNRLTAAYVVLVSAVAALAFDVDRDRDVDLADYETVFTCLTESGSPLAPDCFVADIDGNGRVDLRDFGAYQVCFSGEGIEAAQECLPLRVEIGAPDNVLLGYPTNLGAAVTNPGGQTVFQWTIVDGLAVLEGDALQSPTIRALSDDPIQLAVTVTDTDSSWVAYDFVAIGVVNEPMDPEVDILVVPATTVDEDSVLVLKAEASDPLGLAIVEISWTQFGGPLLLNPFSNPTSASTNFNTCCPGTYSVAVVARNELGRIAKATTQLVINDIDSPRDLRVDGGPDRTFIPVPADFAGAAPFGVGAALYAGSPGGVVPNLSAVVNRSPTVDLAYQWSVTQTPDGTDSGDVVILNESLPDPGYLILPEVTNTTPTLNSTGLTGTISSVVMPGAYEFTVEVTDLETLENSTDSVTFTIVPAFGIPAGAGALQGPALENGSLRHHVTSPDSFDQSVTVLTRLAGTLNFHLQDVGNNTVAATIDLNGDGAVNAGDRYADFVPTQLLNSVGAAPPSPLDTFDVVANVSSIFRGTYLLQASLSAGTASAAPGPSSGLGVVHIQPDLPPELDVRPVFSGSPFRHVGVINSTNQTFGNTFRTVVHGAHSPPGAASLWDGSAVASYDLNGDGLDEIVTATATVVSIQRGYSNDPTVPTNSPVDNAVNNSGRLFSGAAASNSTSVIDTFAIAGAVRITSIAVCNLDNDGNPDLVVCDPFFDAAAFTGTEGRCQIYYGRNNKAFAQNPWTTTGATVSGGGGGVLVTPVALTRPDANSYDFDNFGFACACGNLNGDAFDDLVITAPGGGQAYAVSALTTNVANARDETALTAIDVTGSGDPTGTIQAGDLVVFDPAGNNILRRCTAVTATLVTVDAAVGANLDDTDTVQLVTGPTGAVYGFFGNLIRLSNTTISDAGSEASFRIIPNSARSGDMIGTSLALGDISGDGLLDIIFGAPGRKDSATNSNVCAGVVFVTNGRTSGLAGAISTIDRIYEGNVAFIGFGRQVAALDFNGDGRADIFASAAIGATPPATAALATATTGRAVFISGTQPSIQTTAGGFSALANLPTINGSTSTGNLGTRLCGGDLNDDGFDDLLLLNASSTAANQQVVIVNGSANPPPSLLATTTITHGAGTQFLSTPTAATFITGFAPAGVAYTGDNCGFVDVNSDKVNDFFWQGLNAVSDGHVIYGRE